jgi:hypothetical protein
LSRNEIENAKKSNRLQTTNFEIPQSFVKITDLIALVDDVGRHAHLVGTDLEHDTHVVLRSIDHLAIRDDNKDKSRKTFCRHILSSVSFSAQKLDFFELRNKRVLRNER